MPTRPAQVLPLLGPVSTPGLVDSVARRIREAVRLGLMAPGEQLPSEGVLAGHLGVSTVTLREALAGLREGGLIEDAGAAVTAVRSSVQPGAPVGRGAVGPPRRHERHRAARRGRRVLRRGGAVRVAGSVPLGPRERPAAGDLRCRAGGGAGRWRGAPGPTAASGSRWRSASQSERLTRSAVRLQAIVGELVWLPKGTPLDGAAVAAALGSARRGDRGRGRGGSPSAGRGAGRPDHAGRLIATHLQLTRRPRGRGPVARVDPCRPASRRLPWRWPPSPTTCSRPWACSWPC